MSHAYRFFAAEVRAGRARLSGGDRRHLERVLRMGQGDAVEVVAGGRVYRARVGEGDLELLEELGPAPSAPPIAVWLAQPGGRSDTAVEKLTELGVAAIGALAAERVKGGFTPARLDRWRRVAAAAAKQSRRADVPAVEGPRTPAEVAGPDAVMLSNEGADHALGEALAGRTAVALLVGPEPGFSPAEIDAAREAGAAVCSLGPPVLRSETAAVAGATIALHALGWLP